MLTMILFVQHHIIDNMTLEELDNALKKLGLDIESDAGKNTRNAILGLYGRSILNSKKERCLHCWMKETNQCGKFPCEYIGIPDDEVDVAAVLMMCGATYLEENPNALKDFEIALEMIRFARMLGEVLK